MKLNFLGRVGSICFSLYHLGSAIHGPCESDDDCGTMDTICHKGVCACRENFAVWFDSCIPCKYSKNQFLYMSFFLLNQDSISTRCLTNFVMIIVRYTVDGVIVCVPALLNKKTKLFRAKTVTSIFGKTRKTQQSPRKQFKHVN